MLLDRILTGLFDHSVKLLILVLAVGGIVMWLTIEGGDPVKGLEARCKEQRLPVRMLKVEPGSDLENRFLLMVPAKNRERLPDGSWMFCRANLLRTP